MVEIGLFQLENLILTRSPFLFFAVDLSDTVIDKRVFSLVEKAKKISRDDLLTHLLKTSVEKKFPLVLLGQDNLTLLKTVAQLERSGFENVYLITGGVAGLLSELGDETCHIV